MPPLGAEQPGLQAETVIACRPGRASAFATALRSGRTSAQLIGVLIGVPGGTICASKVRSSSGVESLIGGRPRRLSRLVRCALAVVVFGRLSAYTTS